MDEKEKKAKIVEEWELEEKEFGEKFHEDVTPPPAVLEKNKPMEDVPPAFRGFVGYAKPDAELAKSLDELRHERGYSRAVVDDFVSKVMNPEWLPPAAAMLLYTYMLTKYHAAFQSFGGITRAKLTQLYRFWDESHPWVKANICYELRQGFYDKHHRDYSRDFFAKARRYDKIKEEADEENGA
jgi:hypothetical protein